jgi:hypothetical protein
LDENEVKFLKKISDSSKETHLLTEYVVEEPLIAGSIALMQFIIAVATEVTSLMMINGQKLIFDVIVNFIAIKVIAEIDNIFIQGISDEKFLKITQTSEGQEWTPKRIYNKVPFEERTFREMIVFVPYKMLKLLFNSVYFYFFPFIVLIFNMYSYPCDVLEYPP